MTSRSRRSDAGGAAPPVKVSVVVCTRERAARLTRTLESYERLRFTHAWELVVVINASIDGTPDVVERFRSRTRVPLVVVQEPVPGICAARNAGWRSSHGEIVAFVDDDCYPAEDYLAQLLTCFDEGDLGYVGGLMVLFDDTDVPLSVHARAERRDLPPRSPGWSGLIHGGNMAFRRETLEAIDGFDTWLGAGTPVKSGGDRDAVSRASAAGYAGCFDPRPLVFHHHGRKTAEEGERVRAGYDLGRGAFLGKCLLDPRRRSIYSRSIRAHLREHIRQRRFTTLRREVQGALTYLVTRGMRLSPRR